MPNIYLQRYALPVHYLSQDQYGNPDVVIILPCHNEEDLITSLESLENCEKVDVNISVIVVINASESSAIEVTSRNIAINQECQAWIDSGPKNLTYHLILENKLPKKHAGVGLARKLGMDEAIRIFEFNQKDGVLLCFDADSTCDSNLLIEIYKLFYGNEKINACSIHFEHPLKGELDQALYDGIANYELHLRYYVDGLKYANFPYAYHAVGSSMAVRSSVYQKQGGMNRRKAGEDFYFLHKIIPLGNFKNLNSTKIIPSPRRSDRVPFGTGRAMGVWLDEGKVEMYSYSPRVFEDLKLFFSIVDDLYDLDEEKTALKWQKFSASIKSFVKFDVFISKVKEVNAHSSSLTIFRRRFFQWFDGFKVLKFVHFARDNYYPNVSISSGIVWLFDKFGLENENLSIVEMLLRLRDWDKSN